METNNNNPENPNDRINSENFGNTNDGNREFDSADEGEFDTEETPNSDFDESDSEWNADETFEDEDDL